MSLAKTLTVIEALDSALVSGQTIVDLFEEFREVGVTVQVTAVSGEAGSTEFIKIVVPGLCGKQGGGCSKTLGIIGRLGGVGARPSRIGIVSDADGAVAAIAAALKLAHMRSQGDLLAGDVIVTTHICPNAPSFPNRPVDFMGSPVAMDVANTHEVLAEMDAILSIDTTKGNRIINHKGFAISPTVKGGYILQVAEDLLRIMEVASGRAPVTFPVTMQDITPYGNGLPHLNSILQPSTCTAAPVVGVAITTESMVPGCATGASHEVDIANVVKFSVEIAKEFGAGTCDFYNAVHYARLVELYGELTHFQGLEAPTRASLEAIY